MPSKLKRILNKVLKYMVEGRFIARVQEGLDEGIARIGRALMRHITETDENKVFFHTQENRYCCNPKYICEEFRRRGLGVDLVWRIAAEGGTRGSIPNDVRIVSGGTFEYFKEILSAKYVITNSVLYVRQGFKLKKDQVLFQTWHGSLGIKRFGKNDYKGGVLWVKGAIETGKMTDYCITNSTFVSGSLRNTYWPDTPMLEYGHPRNDIMFDIHAQRREKIRRAFYEKHGLNPDVKLIMYGPTFRDSKTFDCYDIDMAGVLDAARQRFGGEWKLLLRYHSALRPVYQGMKLEDSIAADVIDVTDYDDMQELITLADIAVTDYSSWIYDFMLQRRPGFIFATDIALYNTERGFCYPLETTPFPIATSREALCEAIRSFDEKAYQEKLEAFLEDKGCVEDGHASERVVDKILEMMDESKKKNGKR